EASPDPRAGPAVGRIAPPPPRPADSRGFTRPTPLYLAVLPFEVGEAKDDAEGACRTLATRIGQTLTAALSGSEGLSVVRSPDPAVAEGRPDGQALARAIGANALLSGRIDRSGTELRVTYSVLDPWRGTAVAGGVVDGSAFHPFELEDRL